MSERSWFVASEDGKQDGPCPESQLGALITSGRLTRETLVWTEGMSDWQRAADVPGFVFTAQPPPPRPEPLPGEALWSDNRLGDAFSADFGVWALLWRSLLLVVGTLLVIPAPWVFTHFYRWAIAHVRVPQRPDLAFTGQPGDIWYVFMLLGLCSYAGVSHIKYLPLVLIPFQAFLSWMVIRWVVANISSEGRQLPLNFVGSVWAYIGWTIFLDLSIITIIGWAWVETAWIRWMVRNVEGTTRAISFNASGWAMLWRTLVFVLTCFFIVPIPWTMNWYARWLVSQFSLEARLA
jgi:hypothetical protein